MDSRTEVILIVSWLYVQSNKFRLLIKCLVRFSIANSRESVKTCKEFELSLFYNVDLKIGYY